MNPCRVASVIKTESLEMLQICTMCKFNQWHYIGLVANKRTITSALPQEQAGISAHLPLRSDGQGAPHTQSLMYWFNQRHRQGYTAHPRCGMGTDFAWFFLRFQTKRVQQRTFCVVKSSLHEKNGAQIREEVINRFKTIFTEYHDISGGNIYEYKYQIWPTFFKKCYTNLKRDQFL